MRVSLFIFFLITSFFVCAQNSVPVSPAKMIGLFEDHADVGNPIRHGNVTYNAETGEYLIQGAGSNMWKGIDQFHFLWKKIKGDFIITATIQFIGNGVAGHRKIGIIAREKLTTGSRYADACVHGGQPLLTSLQYRLADDDTTGQVIVASTHPTDIYFQRSGNVFTFSSAVAGENYKTVTKQMQLNEELYTGLFICSHADTVIEKSVFSNVRIIIPAANDFRPYKDYIGSLLEVMDVQTRNRTIVHTDHGSIQGPNWTKDGKSLIYNSSAGLLYKFDLASKTETPINTGFAKSNNNDHVLSFDGKMIGLSNYVGAGHTSTIFILPVTGSDNPVQITSADSGHSYFHCWSPDAKKLIFTGFRNKQYNIWAIDIATKKETALTTQPTLDDGAEYSPDGKWIYFNSVRTGTMKIWRMKADGSQQEQVTFDEYNDWFPHFSPDGKWIVYLSFPTDIDPTTHPFYKNVYLRLMPAAGGVPKNIAYVYGGQGSINVPSWSPDSKKIAFVSNTQLK